MLIVVACREFGLRRGLCSWGNLFSRPARKIKVLAARLGRNVKFGARARCRLGIPTSETLAPRVSTVVDACFSKALREIKSRLQCELLNIERDAVTRHLTQSKPRRSGLILRARAVEVKGVVWASPPESRMEVAV